jgi:hypothetical protein
LARRPLSCLVEKCRVSIVLQMKSHTNGIVTVVYMRDGSVLDTGVKYVDRSGIPSMRVTGEICPSLPSPSGGVYLKNEYWDGLNFPKPSPLRDLSFEMFIYGKGTWLRIALTLTLGLNVSQMRRLSLEALKWATRCTTKARLVALQTCAHWLTNITRHSCKCCLIPPFPRLSTRSTWCTTVKATCGSWNEKG